MAYRHGEMRSNASSNVPKATLKRRVYGGNINAVNRVQAFGRFTDLPKEIQDELSKHVLLLEETFFGFTVHDLRLPAFQLAEAKNLAHRLNREKEMAEDKWYYGFTSSQPEITLRLPEPTTTARAECFNKQHVKEIS